MQTEEPIKKGADSIGIPKNFTDNSDEADLKGIFDENKRKPEISRNHFLLLDNEERQKISSIIIDNKEQILSEWLKEEEMYAFYKKYLLTEDEISVYLLYFGGERILNSLITELDESYAEGKYAYISTRFLAFIKQKKLEIDDLLQITIILKNCIIEHFLDHDLRVLNQITVIFDKITNNLSKNYNDIVIKLLKEYTNAIDNSNIISKTDIYGTIIEVNEAFCKLSGYTRDEMVGKPHNIVRHPDMPKETFRDMWETIKNKKIWKGVVKNRTKDNGSYWVKATVVPIVDEYDQIIEYISIRTEITELKEAYKNLEEYTEALNETNLVLKMNKGGSIESVNEEFLKMSGYKKEELIGKCYMPELLSCPLSNKKSIRIPIVSSDDIKEIQNCLMQNKIWKGVIKNINRKGLYFWTSSNLVPILDLNDNVTEYVMIQTDITDLEIAQQELKVSLIKQKELDTKKDEFLNIASHELRTPMTSVKGYISMILEGDAGEINPVVRTYLEQVYKSSERLLNLINDMLDISKIESGQEIIYEKLNLASLITETCIEIQALFEKKGQKFTNIIDFENFEYNTDGNKLKQVLLNLLGNAHKFTGEGGEIILETIIMEDKIKISIKDNGIGISKLDIPKVFEKFGQVKNSLIRDKSGTGLGLPISKAIVENLGGFIELESEIGLGSTFKIYLPLR